jgi:prepilin-type N-terminal cleavage/methylation domain-containing protein
MKKAFTLIELIIVVVIIGILALIAIPRYFANVAKAQKSQIYANLDAMRRAQLAYYAAYGIYGSSFPIAVVLDGETIVNMSDPSQTTWSYYFASDATGDCPEATRQGAMKQPGSICYYGLCMSGKPYGSCTP